MKKLIYLLIVFTALFSCKKKVLENNILIPHEGLDYVDCNCPSKELDLETMFGSPSVYSVYDETLYYTPQINPNNPNEIAFVSNPHGDDSQTQLIIYNLGTNEKRILIENMYVSTSLSWGKKDWILFMSDGFQLYKIKSNGDSLTPIGNGQWLAPSWNAVGDKFVVGYRFNSISQPRVYVLNENGDILHSINDNWTHNGSGNWSHPEYYIRNDSKNIYLMNLEFNKVIKQIKLPFYYPENGEGQIGVYNRVGWISYNKLIFDYMGGYILTILPLIRFNTSDVHVNQLFLAQLVVLLSIRK